MMNTIHQHPDKPALAEDFTLFLKKLMQEKSTVYVALSGGSTPKALFDFWAEHEAGGIPWERIHCFWGDERCVPPDDADSNFGMTRQHLFSHIDMPESNIHRIRGEANPNEEIKRYSDEIIQHVPASKGVPQFDLVLLGMGDDGHTASIFSHQIELWHSVRLCEVAKHPDSGQQRISLTGKLINNAAYRAFLVTGESKAEKVGKILNKTGNWPSYPAALVIPENTHWFLDDDAARQLA